MSEDATTCQAQCEEPPGYWYTHTCTRNATTERQGMPLCTQHARMADKHTFLIRKWKRGPA